MKKKLVLLFFLVTVLAATSVFAACQPENENTTRDVSVSFSLNYLDAPQAPADKMLAVGSAYGELPTPTREKFGFLGWYTAAKSGQIVTATSLVTNPSNHTLYARWEGEPVRATFDPNGGAFTETPLGFLSDENGVYKAVKIEGIYGSVPTNVEYTGKLFVGWYASADGTGEQVLSSTTVLGTADHVLYAKWKDSRFDFEDPIDIGYFETYHGGGEGLSIVARAEDEHWLKVTGSDHTATDRYLSYSILTKKDQLYTFTADFENPDAIDQFSIFHNDAWTDCYNIKSGGENGELLANWDAPLTFSHRITADMPQKFTIFVRYKSDTSYNDMAFYIDDFWYGNLSIDMEKTAFDFEDLLQYDMGRFTTEGTNMKLATVADETGNHRLAVSGGSKTQVVYFDKHLAQWDYFTFTLDFNDAAKIAEVALFWNVAWDPYIQLDISGWDGAKAITQVIEAVPDSATKLGICIKYTDEAVLANETFYIDDFSFGTVDHTKTVIDFERAYDYWRFYTDGTNVKLSIVEGEADNHRLSISGEGKEQYFYFNKAVAQWDYFTFMLDFSDVTKIDEAAIFWNNSWDPYVSLDLSGWDGPKAITQVIDAVPDSAAKMRLYIKYIDDANPLDEAVYIDDFSFGTIDKAVYDFEDALDQYRFFTDDDGVSTDIVSDGSDGKCLEISGAVTTQYLHFNKTAEVGETYSFDIVFKNATAISQIAFFYDDGWASWGEITVEADGSATVTHTIGEYSGLTTFRIYLVYDDEAELEDKVFYIDNFTVTAAATGEEEA